MTGPSASYAKKLCLVFLLAATGVACAGSFEDFFNAIRQDNAGRVSELLARGFDANTTDSKGQTGLYLALREPSPKAAQVLMDWPKTDVNKLNAQGESILMLAALKGQLELADRLIKKGADVNKTGWTPLHYAASGGNTALIDLLLENSAYIDAESPNGSTPLMMAAMYGSEASVKLLLQQGADTKLKNQQGLTALDFAQRGKRPDSVEAIAAAIRSKRPVGRW
ncbi:ankyrin repeat domain-containing protein [Polaromonas sp.]|uniref:ankyrin repeat domain-containing protein n=1 Tax=Polaromonas sp. TaxID=1869339 RepID=UPI0013BC2893|nr:ankyrin repeat domain-containing protein [Polaromonas sp.]NDP62245.1 ankyrin repeat domain-containing protein [Polaromonas sp.]